MILISGSRYWNRHSQGVVSKYIFKRVHSALEREQHLIVGDNPHGVDAIVVDSILNYGASGTVYGVTPEPRYKYARLLRYEVVGNPVWNAKYADYRRRDKHMVSLANSVIAIWNQESKGTLGVYRDAVMLRKEATLLIVERGQIKVHRYNASSDTQLGLFD